MGDCFEWTYDPAAQQGRQNYDWDCSAAATAWMGRSTGWGWVEENVAWEFVRWGIATPQLGLLDGTGAGIVRWLAMQPYTANNERVDWNRISDLVLTCPAIIGSTRWYHWSGVRGTDDSGSLVLANSAPGWAGIWQSMDREQFETFGDFWAVYPAG